MFTEGGTKGSTRAQAGLRVNGINSTRVSSFVPFTSPTRQILVSSLSSLTFALSHSLAYGSGPSAADSARLTRECPRLAMSFTGQQQPCSAEQTIQRLNRYSTRNKRLISPLKTYNGSLPAWSSENVLYWVKSLVQTVATRALQWRDVDKEYLDAEWYGLGMIKGLR
jgi:hypothetical protein